MATQAQRQITFGDPNSSYFAFLDVLYDDQTLLITGVQGENLTSQPASITYNGHTTTVPANTPLTTIDVSNRNEHMVQFTNARGIQVLILPGGSVNCKFG